MTDTADTSSTEASVPEANDEALARQVARCPNCQTEVTGPYCPTCGQHQRNLNKHFWLLAGEALDGVFSLDSRTVNTLIPLLFKPGRLTTDFFEGRRARYLPPVRLYLIISFLFFIVMPLASSLSDTQSIVIDDQTFIEDSVTASVKDTDKEATENATTDETALPAEAADDIEAMIELPGLTAEENKQLSERFQRQVEKIQDLLKDDPGGLMREVMDVSSAIMFFMLPLFAIFLKIFYLGSGFYYAEHLLLAIHNHCFVYINLLAIMVFQTLESTAFNIVAEPLLTGLLIWLPVYIFLSMKHAYGQGLFVTTLKFCLLGISYFVLTLIGLVTALLLSIMLA